MKKQTEIIAFTESMILKVVLLVETLAGETRNCEMESDYP